VGFTVGPLLAGLFINYSGIKNIWPLMFLLSVISSILMFLLYFIEKRTSNSLFAVLFIVMAYLMILSRKISTII